MLKIIVAEDEEIIRYGIVHSIQEKDKGTHFEVVAECEDGEEALEKITEIQPDIIITDIKMPFMDGLTLLEKLKIRESEMFAVILSGHDEFDYARRAIQAGAFDYIFDDVKILTRGILGLRQEQQTEKEQLVKAEQETEKEQLVKAEQQTKKEELTEEQKKGTESTGK